MASILVVSTAYRNADRHVLFRLELTGYLYAAALFDLVNEETSDLDQSGRLIGRLISKYIQWFVLSWVVWKHYCPCC